VSLSGWVDASDVGKYQVPNDVCAVLHSGKYRVLSWSGTAQNNSADPQFPLHPLHIAVDRVLSILKSDGIKVSDRYKTNQGLIENRPSTVHVYLAETHIRKEEGGDILTPESNVFVRWVLRGSKALLLSGKYRHLDINKVGEKHHPVRYGVVVNLADFQFLLSRTICTPRPRVRFPVSKFFLVRIHPSYILFLLASFVSCTLENHIFKMMKSDGLYLLW
jgi:hypothetical protein